MTQPAQATLLQLLQEGATGCLSGQNSTHRYALYLMSGDLIAALTDQDTWRILELLHNRRRISMVQVNSILRRVNAGETLADLLLTEVSDELLSRLFYDRFQENIFEFLAFVEDFEFEPMEAIFVENIQVGHDSSVLVHSLSDIRQRIHDAALVPEMMLRRGMVAPGTEDEQLLVETFGDLLTLEELLRRSPLERSRTLSLVLDMLEAGVFQDISPRQATPQIAPMPLPVEPVIEVELPLQPPVLPPVPHEDETPTSKGNPIPQGLPQTPVADYSDEDLEAFKNHDDIREGGDFTNISRESVELGANELPLMGPDRKIIDPIELEDAEGASKDGKSVVALNFAGRRLDDSDIRRKISVVNEVLVTVVEALNNQRLGMGNAQLQLLLEGAPVAFAPLFKGVDADGSGQLPVELLMKNLRKRPPSEQRQIFNRGLSDLIDRTLSMAGQNLDEEPMEDVLERIAGFQQRFGL